MSETSEEKTLPASEKKIDDARKKGQVLHSPDMVSGVIMLSCTLFSDLYRPGFAGTNWCFGRRGFPYL
ncbi:EscU/YscU/HrcU family type III secretion system export apparatus switch protein (plasmid) [Phyllobacterium sp. A18/5-2]|uniref:EscU/YscU/HrcU family type III secretion system export apparatus switch protein n=1 Tax=Phyllobacterium sp. A18/5-2 TaxID=2978392 RepID=UPI0021CA36F9|nr:EscU/YscU/HrcU family type III secretion system export apparatus switch protein [Phyllobacterium sp. A18/5-2]UXN66874.1 EscU/YscU/HrcU family type III secretion system export apparatus switch protein [Phyllobacterium sp. A18/5-2]